MVKKNFTREHPEAPGSRWNIAVSSEANRAEEDRALRSSKGAKEGGKFFRFARLELLNSEPETGGAASALRILLPGNMALRAKGPTSSQPGPGGPGFRAAN